MEHTIGRVATEVPSMWGTTREALSAIDVEVENVWVGPNIVQRGTFKAFRWGSDISEEKSLIVSFLT